MFQCGCCSYFLLPCTASLQLDWSVVSIEVLWLVILSTSQRAYDSSNNIDSSSNRFTCSGKKREEEKRERERQKERKTKKIRRKKDVKIVLVFIETQ